MVLLISRSFNSVFDRFQPYERARLRTRFADPLFQAFLEAQVAEAQIQITDVDPTKFTKDRAVEFLQACQEARQIAQFWREFSDFVKDWSSTDV